MTGNNENMEMQGAEPADMLLKHLFHLKRYETPEVSRLTRNKQNIMREIRQASQNKRKSVGDLLEMNFPWLFAEPKYGVAMLFVAFAGLQYMGINARHDAQSNTGIYTTTDRFASYEQPANVSSNPIVYPEVPANLRLFGDQRKSDDVIWVVNEEPEPR